MSRHGADAAGLSRRSLLKRGMVLGGAAAFPSVLGGCSALGFGDTLGDIKDAGVVTVGYAGERPFSYDEDGELTGAIVAVHRAIFDRIGGIAVEGVLVPFRELLDGLNEGSYDVVAAGMFITEDRCAVADFSEPTYCSRSGLLVRRGNPLDLSDYESVTASDATLGVLGGAIEEDYASEAGVSDDAIVHVGDQDDGLEMVASGEIDAFTLTSISLRTLIEAARQAEELPPAGLETQARPVDQVELVEPFEPVVDGEPQRGCGAAAFRKTDEDLLDAFNAELASLHEEGRVLELVEPYGFTADDMPDPDLTAEELCETGGDSGGGVDLGPR